MSLVLNLHMVLRKLTVSLFSFVDPPTSRRRLRPGKTHDDSRLVLRIHGKGANSSFFYKLASATERRLSARAGGRIMTVT